MATTEFKNAISRRVAPPKLLVGEDTATSTSGRAAGVDSDGRVQTAEVVAVAGGTPVATTGVPALIPETLTHTYDTAKTLTIVPQVNGVSVSIAVGAGPVAVAAVGNAIAVTALQVGVTTYANLKAAWDADAAVVALATLTGTAGTFPGAYAGLTSTVLANTRTVAGGGIVGFCTDGVWRPVKLTTDGSIEVSVTVGDEMKVHAWQPVAGAAATELVAETARMPEAKTTVMDGAETMTFTPKVGGVSVVLATGAARLLNVVGRTVYITVIASTTTDTEVIADIAANPTATALLTPTGTVGTFAAGYAGETLYLWTARTVATGQAMQRMSDGAVQPLEGDAATGALKTYQRGMNTATDAQQTLAVAAPPKGVNGPAVLLSSAALAEVAGSYDIDIPVSNYDELTIQVYIDAAAGDTYQIDLYARIDDQAAGDWHLVNGQFTATGATALGAAADPCALIACATGLRMFRELRVRRTKTNNNGNAVARIWAMFGR